MNRQRIWLGLAVVVVALVVVTVAAGQTRNAGATASCESGTAVSNPADNPGLVSDCETLLGAKDTLRGTETLNWSADHAMPSWTGVTVAGTPQRVTKLVIESGTLNGAIPASLGDLSALTHLRLGWNQLTGTIPPGLGNLTRLTQLNLAGNRLSGAIPPELGSIGASLTHLVLSGPSPLPSGIGLTGSIPPELGYLSGLQSLYLDGNRLTGTIPTRLGRLANLTWLLLTRNQLSGPIPTQLGDLTTLSQLQLQDNNLSGAIPTQLGDLRNLRKAYLKDNSGFTGCVPRGLGDVRFNDVAHLNLPYCDADAPPTPMTPLPTHTLTVSTTGAGSVTPAGTTTHDEGSEVILTATWDDATHYLQSWGGACSGMEGATCTLRPFDDDATVTATFAERCTGGATDPTCIRVVYIGAPDDYPNVTDIPANFTFTPNSEGRYEVGRGEQITVVTGGASLPAGYTRFYLQRTPLTTDPSPLSDERLILPAGTSYTFTVASSAASGELLTFDLTPGNPPQTPNQDPVLGAAAVTSTFEVLHVPELILISDGSHNALTLEWTRGPTSTTGWEYRVRTWTGGAPDAWGSWTDVPNSTATTRTHRLTGLLVRRAYDAQVRAVAPRVQVVESNVAEGSTQHEAGTLPQISPYMIVEGDGVTRWRVHSLDWTITIPDGMRIRAGGAGAIASNGRISLIVFDHESGALLRFSRVGTELERELPPQPQAGPRGASGASEGAGETEPARDVGAMFDQIVASVSTVPVE